MNCKYSRHITLVVMLLLTVAAAMAQDNDKVLNRQYADMKKLHFGFSIGMNFQDLNITNNGFTTADGEQWYADVPNHSPGFSVNVLADYRLGQHFNLRFSPGMYFGNKVVKYINALGDATAPDKTHYRQSQNIKSTYVVLPVEVKFSALRRHNYRPYFTSGVMGVVDVSKDRPDQLQLKNSDVMLTVGMGCDFYLPFFKFCPEVKFCFGLKNMLKKDRPDLQDNELMMRFTQSVDKIKDNMVVVTFYFE